MDPLTLLAFAKFATTALRDGVPVVENILELLHASSDPEARKLIPGLEAAYATSRQRATDAHNRLQGS